MAFHQPQHQYNLQHCEIIKQSHEEHYLNKLKNRQKYITKKIDAKDMVCEIQNKWCTGNAYRQIPYRKADGFKERWCCDSCAKEIAKEKNESIVQLT